MVFVIQRSVLTVILVTEAVHTLSTSFQNLRLPPTSPFAGLTRTPFMHCDAGSSDATPLAGPGSGELNTSFTTLLAVCPTVLIGKDNHPIVLGTNLLDQTPIIFLLDPDTQYPIAKLKLSKCLLLGGLYAYLDNFNRLVVTDSNQNLLRVGFRQSILNHWELYINSSLSLRGFVPDHDTILSVIPDWNGNVWFASMYGLVGTVDESTSEVRTLQLPVGEDIANSISSVPSGISVATTYALYLLRSTQNGDIAIVWRRVYDRGPGRKPGQLSWGTGSTPTFFGPVNGTEYLTIVDNAVPYPNLLIYRSDSGNVVCSIPVLKQGGGGSENSPIGAGNSVFITSTYGYPYLSLPSNAGPSVPPSAKFVGGFSRVDVTSDGTGCNLIWDNVLKLSSVPKLSLMDNLIHGVLRSDLLLVSSYRYAQIDPNTGELLRTSFLGTGPLADTSQLAINIFPDGVVYQGSIGGVFRISKP